MSTTAVSPSTARKLRQIADAIVAKPTKFEMNSWANKTEECGTTCCIGGYACVQAGVKPKALMQEYLWVDQVPKRLLGGDVRAHLDDYLDKQWVAAADVAAKALGLDSSDAKYLFYTEHWGAFEAAFDEAESPKAKALVAAARIEHFIATGA